MKAQKEIREPRTNSKITKKRSDKFEEKLAKKTVIMQ